MAEISSIKITQGTHFLWNKHLAKVGPFIDSIEEGEKLLDEALQMPHIKDIYGVYKRGGCVAWNKAGTIQERYIIFRIVPVIYKERIKIVK